MMRKTLVLDFDGVIHSYTSGWKGADVITDPPVPGALDFIKTALERFEVAIYSSRSKDPGGISAMKGWLREHGMEGDVIERLLFPTQKPAAWLTIDDRAWCFDGIWPNDGDWTKKYLDKIDNFRPWYKK